MEKEQDKQEQITLLPCPFCGKAAKVEWFAFGTLCEVDCSDRDCGAEGPCKATEAEAQTAWNTRSERDALRETLKLVQTGLKNGSIKSKPVISFTKDGDNVDMESLHDIVDRALTPSGKS